MNILIITRKFSNNGGIERYTVELSKIMSTNHRVFVLTQESDISVEGVFIIKKEIFKKFPLIINIVLFYIASYFWSIGIKRKYAIDVVISNGSAAIKTDVVVAHSLHIAFVFFDNQYRKKINTKTAIFCLLRYFSPLNILIFFLEFFVYKFGSTHIITVSSGVKDELIKFLNINKNKISVIPNGVDISRFSLDESIRREVRKELNLNDNDIVLCFSGHEFGRKGLNFILKSLEIINSAKSNKNRFKLLVMGKDSSPYYKDLVFNLEISEDVFFLGNITNEIEKYYIASDIFIFPTSYEAFSLATLEAAASGLPILMTKVNGSDELVKDGINGFIIERNVDDIVSKLKLFLKNTEILRSMGKNSRMMAENLSWQNTYDKTVMVLEMVSKSNNLVSEYSYNNKILRILASIIDTIGFIFFRIKKNDRIEIKNLNKIIVFKLDNIGDCFLMTPLFLELKKNNPQLVIDVVCLDYCYDIFKNTEGVDSVITIKNRNFFELFKIIKLIRQKKYDAFIDARGYAISSFFGFLLGIKIRIGFAEECLSFFYTHKIIYDRDIHEFNKYILLLNLLGVSAVSSWKPKLIKKDINNEFLISKFNQKNVCIHVGSSLSYKKWPIENWINLLKIVLNEDKEIVIFLLGSKSEYEDNQHIVNDINDKRIINLSGKLSLYETYCLISRANFFIGNDSALGHMSGSFNIPSIILMNSVIKESRWRPIGDYVKVISGYDPQHNCLFDKCKYPCLNMKAIEVATVINELNKIKK